MESDGFLDQIDYSKAWMRLKIRVSRLWNVMDFNDPKELKCLDMVLIDQNGHQIHASVPKQQLPKYSRHLKEGEVYILEKYNVGQANKKGRPVDHKYKFYFKWDTILKRHPTSCSSTIPMYKFNFVTFDDIAKYYGEEENTIDVIGILDSVGDIIEKLNDKGEVEKRRREIIIKYLSKQELRVTLWGDKGDELGDNIIGMTRRPPIVIVTSGSVKYFNGAYNVSSNTSTKVYIDLDVHEVAPFIHSVNTELKLYEKTTKQTNTLEARMKTTKTALCDLFDKPLNDQSMARKHTCMGTISNIIHDYEPYYLSCNKCPKRVIEQKGQHWCSACEKTVPSPAPRYSVRMRVTDDMSSATIVVFDKDVEDLICEPVSNIVALNDMEN